MNDIWGKVSHLIRQKLDSSRPDTKTHSYPGLLKLSALRPRPKEDLFAAGKTLFEKEAWQDESLPFNTEMVMVGTTLTITLISRSAEYDNCLAQIQLVESDHVAYEVVIAITKGSGSYKTHVNQLPKANH